MIIMINGAYGVGKSTVANQLKVKLPGAIIYDPEEVGFMIRNLIPEELKCENEKTGDFQDFELWRILVVEVAKNIVGKYKCDLIIPMTLCEKKYFDYIFQGLRTIDNVTSHFCLMASLETIQMRLELRGDVVNSWPFLQTERCIKAFSENNFEEYIECENLASEEVAEYIIERLGLAQ